MSKQFLVIGAGWFGASVAKNLYELGHDVMVLDVNAKRVKEISSQVTHAVEGDATSEDSLKALDIKSYDLVVVAIGENLQVSIMTTILLVELEARYIVTKAQSILHGKVLEKIGANQVVFPEIDMGKRLARNIIAPSMIDLIELSPRLTVVEIKAPKKLVGKSLKELELRAKFGINIIALHRENKDDPIIAPLAEDIIEDGDTIVAIGTNEAHKKMNWI